MATKKNLKRRVATPKAEVATRVSQGDFPALSLDQALRVPKALNDDFAGRSAAPHDIALAINMSPTSGPWRSLCGAAIAYGLTEGGYAADAIKLTPLGRRIVAPEAEGDDRMARVEAILRPRVMRLFFEKYDRAKFPQDAIAQNVLVSLGLPRNRAEDALESLKQNGRLVGIIRETKTGPFVSIGLPAVSSGGEDSTERDVAASNHASLRAKAFDSDEKDEVVGPESMRATQSGTNNRVFISHGKNKSVVTQIRELLTFGGFEPVISVDQERTAISVPEKVFEDMRTSSAGVIHVSGEGKLLDEHGESRVFINQNVLIEIGAALALYGKRVVLLVERGLSLPSNLQGLYRCEYEGDKLDYEATMKLLKTFNQFKASN